MREGAQWQGTQENSREPQVEKAPRGKAPNPAPKVKAPNEVKSRSSERARVPSVRLRGYSLK